MRPIKESLEKLADNSNYQLQVDMIRYDRLKKQKEESDKLGATVPFYDEELSRLEKKLTQPSYRRFSKDLLATAQLGISLIPKVMLLNAASEPALKLTGDIAEQVGGENVRGVTETLTHLGLAATLGLPVLVGSLASMGAEETAKKLLDGTELNEEDKAIILEASGHIGFLAGMVTGVKIKGNESKRFDPNNMNFIPDVMFPRGLETYSRFETTLGRPLTKLEQKIVDIYNKRQEDIRKNPDQAYSREETKIYEDRVKKIKEDAGEKVTDVYKLLFPEEFKTEPPKPPFKEEKPKGKGIKKVEKELGITPGPPPITETEMPGLTLEEETAIADALVDKVARDQQLTPEELQIWNKYPNYIKTKARIVKESPEFKQEQSLIRQQEKQKAKLDTDNYSNLTRQFKNAQRKRQLFDAEILRQGIAEITSPEVKAKAEQLLADAEKHNTDLVKKNEFTLENLSRRKYGTTDINSLEEDKQQALLNEYNEMKKQGITEFKQLESTIPRYKKGEPDAIQKPTAEEILQRQPGGVGGTGGKREQVEQRIERQEITEAEEEGFLKRPSEEETRIVKPEDDLEVETEPTEAQIEAGNYKKGHIKRDGFDISLENLKGSIRSGTDKAGKKWEVEMQNDYGYIKGTVAKDKDHLDVFLAEDYKENSPVFIVNQTTPEGKFDEHKVMLGFDNKLDARNAYISNYEEGKANFSNVVEMPMNEFKEWSKDPKQTKKPAGGGRFYRGGGEGSMPKNKTAQDIIDYETKELGNKIQVEPGINLDEIASEKLLWLTESEEDALEYGEAEEVELYGGYRIIARDQDGGVLIEKNFPEDNNKVAASECSVKEIQQAR